MQKINFRVFSSLLASIAILAACNKIAEPAPRAFTLAPGKVSSILPDAEVSNFEIVAYMPYWALPDYEEYDLQYQNITTLIMLAAVSKNSVHDTTKNGLVWNDSDSRENSFDQPDLNTMISYIRSVNPSIKIFLGLADLADTPSRATAAILWNDTYRDSTISWLMNRYIDTFDFDGIDIDFEDESLTPGYIYDNYPKLVKGISLALADTAQRGRKKLCTITLGNDWHNTAVIDDTVRAYASWLGCQTYSSEKMDSIVINGNRDVRASLAGWTGPGELPASKLLIGMLGHAVGVNSSGLHQKDSKYSYYQLLTNPPKDTAFLPYLTTSLNIYDDTSSFIHLRFNGMYETRRKLEWVVENGIKGVFFWDISKDARGDYEQYSLLELINHAYSNPNEYDKIVGFTMQDFYSSSQTITGGFHSLSMPSSPYNWVGVYELHTGNSTGYYQYLSTGAKGTFTIPSTLTATLDANKLYILRFYNGQNGMGTTFYGTSHPFYKL